VNLGAVVLIGSDNVSGDFPSKGLFAAPSDLTPGSIATTEILGRTILDRVTTSLLQAGVHSISLICQSRLASSQALPHGDAITRSFFSDSSEFFDLVEERVSDQIEKGASVVLLVKLESYLEFEFGDVLEFHRDRGQVVTRVRDAEGPLNFWLIDSARARTASLSCASVLMGRSTSRLQYRLRGYSNRLRSAQDLRRLVADGFHSRCGLQPAGKQVKPGIWIDSGASVDRLARLVAPVYIGRNSHVEGGALITRGSNIEAGCSVGGGTVIEDASILQNTFVGQGLEVSHAVVERGRLIHMKRNVAVTVADASLIGATRPLDSGSAFVVNPVVMPVAARTPAERYAVPDRLSEAFGD
jgi:hypothetical protein